MTYLELTPTDKMYLARDGGENNIILTEQDTLKKATLGTEGSGSYLPDLLNGWGSFFYIKKRCQIGLVGLLLNCESPTGGNIKLEFRLYSYNGGELIYIATGYGTRKVTTKGPRVVYCSFGDLYLDAGDYFVAVWIDESYSTGTWKALLTPNSGSTITEYVEPSINAPSSAAQIDTATPVIVAQDTQNYIISRIWCDDYEPRFTFNGAGFYLAAGQELIDGQYWDEFRSKPTVYGETASIIKTVTLSSPGLLEFSRNVYVAESEIQNSELKLIIDGVEKSSWKGNVPWEIFNEMFFLTEGTHTIEWKFLNNDNVEAFASIDNIIIKEFDILRYCIITDYEPPKPNLKTNEVELINGFDVIQRGSYKGTSVEMTILIYDSPDYIDFITNIDKIHIFVDELSIMYAGVIKTEDIKPTKIGQKSHYYIDLTLKFPQFTGVGV